MQVKAVDNRRLVSSSLDQTIAVWKQDEGKNLALLRGTDANMHTPFSLPHIALQIFITTKFQVYDVFFSINTV